MRIWGRAVRSMIVTTASESGRAAFTARVARMRNVSSNSLATESANTGTRSSMEVSPALIVSVRAANVL